MKKLLTDKLVSIIYSCLFTPVIFKLIVKIFKITSVTGQGSDQCLKEGFLPVPIHFYSPIPDINDLEERKVWDDRSELKGIDFNVDRQLALLKDLGTNFSEECQWPLQPTEDPADFFISNDVFSYGCAATTHCMIRYFKPANVIEIGAGMSSRVISKAIQLNQVNGDNCCKYTIVEPYPNDVIKNKLIKMTKLVDCRVELLDVDFFKQLKENDILFIDSSHSVKIGGDVNHLFLDVLPSLAPGVIVHFHDIAIPFEVPKFYAVSETFRQFWTEQYLLQSFLCFNNEFEVLLAMNYLMSDHLKLFGDSFPHYDPVRHINNSGSFWIRRKINK